MYNYCLNISNGYRLTIPKNLKIIFLCGVYFDKSNGYDKRIALKEYLQGIETNRAIILEEHFVDASLYGDIDLRNLHDVETLVACFANATIVIHESISTAAELGMLAANKSTSLKTIVLYPDKDSIEEEKISAFIRLAYYKGRYPIFPRHSNIEFTPTLQKVFESNDRYIYHTAFPSNLKTKSRSRDRVDSLLNKAEVKPMESVQFRKASYRKPSTQHPDIIDYFTDNKKLVLHISPMALRCLLFSLLSIEDVRKNINKCSSILEVISSIHEALKKILLGTFQSKLGITSKNIDIKLKGVELSTFQTDPSTTELRKSIGLFVYLLKSMGYLSIIDNKKFKLTSQFSKIKEDFKNTITTISNSSFSKHLNKEIVDA